MTEQQKAILKKLRDLAAECQSLHSLVSDIFAETSDKQEAVKSAYRRGFMAGWNGEGEAISAPSAQSAAGDDVREKAARYDWLKNYGGDYLHWQNLKRLENDGEFDAYIDAAIKQEKGDER